METTVSTKDLAPYPQETGDRTDSASHSTDNEAADGQTPQQDSVTDVAPEAIEAPHDATPSPENDVQEETPSPENDVQEDVQTLRRSTRVRRPPDRYEVSWKKQ